MPNELEDEISAMIKSLEGGTKTAESETKEETKPEETTKSEKSPEQEVSPKTSAPASASPGTKAPATTAPSTEVPEDKDKTIEELRAEIAELKAKPKEEPKGTPTTEAPPAEQDFVGNLDLDELSRDPKEFNKVLNKIYQKAVVDVNTRLVTTLPDMIRTNISVISELKEASEQFYRDNEDLSQFKKVVATVFEELVAKDPKAPILEVVKKLGPEARKKLGLPAPKPKSSGEKPKPTPPRLPQKGGKAGKSQEVQTVDPVQSDIDAMNKTLRR